jgi:HEAT repeat protein
MIRRVRAALLALLTLLAPAKAADPDPAYDGKRLSEWVKQINSSHEADRRTAEDALAALAGESRRVVPALLEAVRDGEETNPSAVSALVRIGPAAVPGITPALWDDDPRKRLTALYVLGSMGDRARSAAGAVVVALGDGDPLIRRNAARVLGRLGSSSAVPALLPLLDQDDREVREEACNALMGLRADARLLLPTLSSWLRSKHAEQRDSAAWLAGNLGAEAAPAVPLLIDALKDGNRQLRTHAVQSLGKVGPAAKDATPALAAALKDNDAPDAYFPWAESLWRIARHPDVAPALQRWLKRAPADKDFGWREETANLLWRIDKSPEAVGALADLLKRAEGQGALRPLMVLGGIGPGARAALPAVVPLLKSEDKDVRFYAARVLGRFGEHGKPAAADLKAAREDRVPLVRAAVALALWQITGDRDALKRLGEGLRADDDDLRAVALQHLACAGKSAKEGAPAVRAALKDKSPAVRRAAAEALGLIDDAPESVAALTEALGDRDAGARAGAAVGLGANFGPAAKPAVAGLTKALWDEDASVRSAAAEALGRIGPEAKAATRALIAVLRSEELEPEPSAAAEALGLIGPAAKEALPVLREKLRHPDSYVRVCAALSLWNIDKDASGAAVAAAALDDRRPRVRVVAAEALWRTKESPRAVPVLLEVLRQSWYAKSGGGRLEQLPLHGGAGPGAHRAAGEGGRTRAARPARRLRALPRGDGGRGGEADRPRGGAESETALTYAVNGPERNAS